MGDTGKLPKDLRDKPAAIVHNIIIFDLEIECLIWTTLRWLLRKSVLCHFMWVSPLRNTIKMGVDFNAD